MEGTALARVEISGAATLAASRLERVRLFIIMGKVSFAARRKEKIRYLYRKRNILMLLRRPPLQVNDRPRGHKTLACGVC
jgi:hypothetical protein